MNEKVPVYGSSLRRDPSKGLDRSKGLKSSSFSQPSASGGKPRKPLKRGPISPASPAQRKKARSEPCVVLRVDALEATVDPAHLAARAHGGCDSAMCIVPLERGVHRVFDDGRLDLLPYLEPHRRAEIAHCVEHLGLVATLQRLTGRKWGPLDE